MEILQGEIGTEITVKSIEGKESFMINSPGGSLWHGLAMYDYVISKNIEVGVIGLCASAATLPLIASSKRWGTPNSRYLIHNPSSHYFIEQKTADDLNKDAEDLRFEQDRALDLYFKILKKPKEEIQALMDQEKVMDAKEALELGLILEIRDIEQDVNPDETKDVKNLYNHFKMQIMEKNEVKSELSGLRLMIDKIFKMLNPVKMLILQDVTGQELDFGSEIETPEQIVVGVSATVSGAPAEGEYTMPSGEVYVFEGGSLTAINQPGVEENAELKKELEDTKIENEILKEEMEIKNKLLVELESKLKIVSSRLDTITSKFTTETPKDVVPPTEPAKKGFSYNRAKIINN